MSRDHGPIQPGEVRRLASLIGSKVDPGLIGLGAGKLTEFLFHIGSSKPISPEPDAGRLQRWQDELIEAQVPPGASVLDLGCGTGDLLARLMERKNARGQGVELDPEAVVACVRRGVPVIHMDLDEGLKEFPDGSFDYAVLEQTLQTLHHPDRMLSEMVRVARSGIVSFPNFACWRVRLDLAFRGRMPVTERLPYHWYDSPNIHMFSLQDFLDWAHEQQVAVVQGYVLADGAVREFRAADNLYAEEALLFVKGADT